MYASIEHVSAQSGDREQLSRSLARVLENSASTILTSANGTWIDRVEEHALRIAKPQAVGGGIYAACGEIFSATPLLGIIATLLQGKSSHFTALCSDWTGCASAVTIRLFEE